MRTERPRVVFDCNLFLQAAISSGGPAAACMELVDEGAVTLVISEGEIGVSRHAAILAAPEPIKWEACET